MANTLSITEAQREITSLPERFETQPEAVTITRHGKPVMAILPFESYRLLIEQLEALQETLEMTLDEDLMASFRQGVRELAEGKGEPLDDVLKEVGWKPNAGK
jgi:prevent-host-death family protein